MPKKSMRQELVMSRQKLADNFYDLAEMHGASADDVAYAEYMLDGAEQCMNAVPIWMVPHLLQSLIGTLATGLESENQVNLERSLLVSVALAVGDRAKVFSRRNREASDMLHNAHQALADVVLGKQ